MRFLFILISIFALSNTSSMRDLSEGAIITNGKSAAKRMSVPNDPRATAIYIPHTVDVSRQLAFESRCCFCSSRWILQPIMVLSSLASVGLVGLGEFFISSDPKTASILNGAGLLCVTASFVAGVLTIKVNNKLATIDNYFDGNLKDIEDNAH